MIIVLTAESLSIARDDGSGLADASDTTGAGASAKRTLPELPAIFAATAGASLRCGTASAETSSRASFSRRAIASWLQAVSSAAMHSRTGELRMSSSM
jgi:hypothetical protein